MDAITPPGAHLHSLADLGDINEPVLVFGGVYSNLEGFSALLEVANNLGIPASRMIHTGDVIAYCADAAACANLLRDQRIPTIKGNVEESLAASLPECGCGFVEGSKCDRLAAEWFAYADANVDDGIRRWMAGLPHHLTFRIAGQSVRVVHGSVSEVNRFIFASQPDADFESEFTIVPDADIVIAGHSGIPFTRRIGKRIWHNSGSLGLPANDGTPRVWYSLLLPEADGLRIEHKSLDYDHATASRKMNEAGICAEYAQTLSSGLWPSLDIVPLKEREDTGKPVRLDDPVVVLEAASA